MADTGVIYASSCADNSGVGSRSWSNPSNVNGAANGSKADCDLTSGFGNQSHFQTGDFAHGLSAGDSIVGVVAGVNRDATLNDTDPPADTVVKLIKNGVVSGTNKAAGAWPQSAAWSSDYGGAADTWGLTLTGADTIGLAVSCTAPDPTDHAYIDAMRMTIYYTPASVNPIRKDIFSGGRMQSRGLKFGGVL